MTPDMIGANGDLQIPSIKTHIYAMYPQTAEYKAFVTKLEAAVSMSKTTPAAREDQLMRFKTDRDRDWEKCAKLLRKVFLYSQKIPLLEAQVKRDRAAAITEAQQDDEDNEAAQLEQQLGVLRQKKRKRLAKIRKERIGDSVDADDDAPMEGRPQPSPLLAELMRLEGQPDGLSRAIDLLQEEKKRQQQPPQQQPPQEQPPPQPVISQLELDQLQAQLAQRHHQRIAHLQKHPVRQPEIVVTLLCKRSVTLVSHLFKNLLHRPRHWPISHLSFQQKLLLVTPTVVTFY